MTAAVQESAPHATSATLYFGPWYRKSPFFEKALEAGCSAYIGKAALEEIRAKGVSKKPVASRSVASSCRSSSMRSGRRGTRAVRSAR
jgi:hypothetical protein